MIIRELDNLFELAAPKQTAIERDNVGLLIGDFNTHITKALLCLDIDENCINQAIQHGCNIIVAHHPMIFNAVKKLNSDTVEGKLLNLLIQNNIAVYAAHTNFDAAPNGLCQFLCEKLGVTELTTYSNGLCNIGCWNGNLSELSAHAKSVLHLQHVRVTGDLTQKIQRVAVCCGGGGSQQSVTEAFNLGANCYLTGDITYSSACLAHNLNSINPFSLIDIGHFESEVIITELFKNMLHGKVETVIATETNVQSWI